MNLPRFATLALVAASFALTVQAQTVTGPSVRFETNLGNIDVVLRPDVAPNTVQNFLNYVNKGAYTNSIIHRSVAGFVIQGGGYQWIDGLVKTAEDAPVANEFNLSNVRGTIAMAKLDNKPDSATNQWYFNLVKNAGLDSSNGGFTVFGNVADSAGLAVMDRISAQITYGATSGGNSFDTIPLINYTAGATFTIDNLVVIRKISQIDTSFPSPAIADNGVISASGFGTLPTVSIGSLVEIYGSNLAGSTRDWSTAFVDSIAPTKLDDVTVTVGGQPAYIAYISPTQINIQIPSNISAGTQPVIVQYKTKPSATVNVTVRTGSAGLLAPPNFKVNGTQYVAAFHADGSNVTGGNVPGVTGAAAAKGETIVLYGVGFGSLTPSGTPIAGKIITTPTQLVNFVTFSVGGIPATTSYAGLAPGLVGVYQFNVVVPAGAKSGDQPLVVTFNGTPLTQSLTLPIK